VGDNAREKSSFSHQVVFLHRLPWLGSIRMQQHDPVILRHVAVGNQSDRTLTGGQVMGRGLAATIQMTVDLQEVYHAVT